MQKRGRKALKECIKAETRPLEEGREKGGDWRSQFLSKKVFREG